MKILHYLVKTLLVILLVISIGIVVAVNFLGYSMYIVLSGSMQPTIQVDDLVVTHKDSFETITVGDIVTYYDAGSYVTHRVKEISGGTLTVQGDANNTIDKVHPTEKEYVGKYLFHIHGGGKVLAFFQTPYGKIVLVGCPIALVLLVSILTPEETKQTEEQTEEQTEKKDE